MDLSDWIDRRAGFAPEKAAMRFADRDIAYRELGVRVRRLAGALQQELGVVRGDRVAYLGLNSPEMLALVFACARLGAIALPLNWRQAPPEHVYVLRDARPKTLFVQSQFAALAAEHAQDLPPMALVGLDGGCGPSALPLAALLDMAPDDCRRDPEAGYDDPALLCYTSGTTGRPKGALLTQSAIFVNAVNSAHMHDMVSADRVLTTLPMFHVGGLNIQTLPALHAGATVTLHAGFDPGAALAAIEAERITLTVLVPTQLRAMMDHPAWERTDLSSLRMISSGSTVVPEALIRAVHARGVPLIQVYGSTETSPIATFVAATDASRKAGSVGQPAMHCALRIVDDAGRDVPAGGPGEIVVKGANVMRGYWNDPEASAECLRDGWFHTGDIGHLDEDGYLWVDGRKKEMIISGGENIYPAALESILAECEDVAEAAVVGRPDDHWGEIAVAVVVPRPGSGLSAERVLDLFRGRIARYTHPREVIFVDALPRNAMGKVRKDHVRHLVTDASPAGEETP